MTSGPYEKIAIGSGRTAPLYVLRYGKNGELLSPKAEEAVRAAAAGASDVFIFAHGWNNVFGVAVDNYRSFARGYADQRAELGLTPSPDYHPVLVGLVWPSTKFVAPWERGPAIAAIRAPEGPPPEDEALETEEMLSLVTDGMPEHDAAAFTEYVDAARLGSDDALSAAAIAMRRWGGQDDPDTGFAPPDERSVVAMAELLAGGGSTPVDDDEGFGTVDGGDTPPQPPAAAAISLDPRMLLRLATVWAMKGRAGTVGVVGVRPLVEHLLGRDQGPRLHLIGHSFGARLVLSALAAADIRRPARSMLLLQPAVNRWCFAPVVQGSGRRGGYADVPARVELPILTTFSPHDFPLHKVFHVALRTSLGELNIAADGATALYGALGGYGPAGLGDAALVVDAARPGTGGYPLDRDLSMIAIRGATRVDAGQGKDKPAIGGHGDISNPVTWWALHCLTAAP